MTDLPQASVLPMPTDDASSLATTSDSAHSQSFNFTTVSQTVLKLTNPAALQQIVAVPVVSGPTEEALQRLVEMIEQLRSPRGGWPPDLAQTPENLTPYVIEEVHEVLHTLQSGVSADPVSPTPDTEHLVRPFWQRYFAVADLIPRLLWFIARSSYDLMQLVGGVRARLCLADDCRVSGVLRLAAVLEATAPKIHWSLDLATNQAAQSDLPEAMIIQADDGNFCKQPTAIADLLQTLIGQIQAATPAIQPFLAQTAADLLAPGQDWQAGFIQLKLNLVFVADDELMAEEEVIHLDPEILEAEIVEDASLEGNPDAIAIVEPVPALDSAPSPLLEALIKLAEPVGQAYYRQSMIRQQMEYALPTLQQHLAQDSDRAVHQIIATAYEIAELVQHPVTWSEYNFLQPEVLFEEWLPKLLWHLTRSAYEVMQLVGGVDASVLQPGCDWQTGTLRLLTVLQIQSATTDWNLDLAVGQLLPQRPEGLSATVVVQADQSDLCQEPDRVGSVLQQVMDQIQPMAPLMALLLAGTQAELLASAGDWQPVALKLHLGLSFIPNVVAGDRFEIPVRGRPFELPG